MIFTSLPFVIGSGLLIGFVIGFVYIMLAQPLIRKKPEQRKKIEIILGMFGMITGFGLAVVLWVEGTTG
ncbi:hypothetical protein [Nitrosophilus alvini]|uniref:hypothetical protein n=1 Tax=Nitrosophilus alvini TaxID=2714855 RepID=UPI00190D6D6F|nr:hypothetical protein [Nitrosophilus alvini]